jgi:hypothetical protein
VKSAYDLASAALPKAGVTITGDLTVEGVLEASVSNAATADKLSSAGTITLAGDASGSVAFDGSDATLTVTIADDSNNHTVENIDNLETLLASKSTIASPTFTGTPKAPTATAGTNTTQIATTAFVTTAVTNGVSSKVTGPASAVSGQIAVFDGTTGKIIKDSGFTIATSVPANAKFTDTNTAVTQTVTTTNASYPLLACATASNTTTKTEGARYASGITINPSTNSITATGTITGSAVYNAVWNDYAEFFPRGEETEAGDFVALSLDSDNEVYVKASKETSKSVGIHSDSFGHLIGGENAPEGQDFVEYNLPKYIPVGLVGRVRANIVGEVKKGDFIVISDIPGVGRAFNKEIDSYVDIIGMACESSSEKDIKRIKVKLGN